MLGKFLKGIAGFFGEAIVEDVKDQVDDALDHAKERIEVMTERLIRKIISLFLVLIGLIFGLVGISKFLSAKVPAFADGVGYVLVGLVLVLLAWFARYMSAEKKD